MSDIKTIGIITKPDDVLLADTVRTLLDYLHTKELAVLVDQSAAMLLEDTDLRPISREEIAERCDLAIVIGGDGTLLHTARSLANAEVPLLGVNRGRMGFLVDVSPDEMIARVDEVLDGKYHEERRFLLQVQALRGERVIAEHEAFNDVVTHVRDAVRMIELETYINGRFVNTQRADGLIVATPSGSTAYALSGGGPILHPCLKAIVLVPICPHTLSSRPIVVDADSRIEIVICRHNKSSAVVSFDGQLDIDLELGDRILIERTHHVLRLVQPRDHDYFQILRAKLRWG